MKLIVLSLALFCIIAYAAAGLGRERFPPRSTGPTFPRGGPRFPRQADNRGSVVIRGEKPLSGPDRRPSLDIDYNHRLAERNGMTADAFGGVNIRPGERAMPHAGLQFERNFRNGFIRGHGQVERGANNRFSPAFGVSGGFRFRRDVIDEPEY